MANHLPARKRAEFPGSSGLLFFFAKVQCSCVECDENCIAGDNDTEGPCAGQQPFVPEMGVNDNAVASMLRPALVATECLPFRMPEPRCQRRSKPREAWRILNHLSVRVSRYITYESRALLLIEDHECKLSRVTAAPTAAATRYRSPRPSSATSPPRR